MPPQFAYTTITVQGNNLQVLTGKNDDFWSKFNEGIWEPDTQAVFRRFIDAQHAYIDMGSWIGSTLVQGCQLAKRAYGIEPDPVAFAELCENMQRNRPLTDNVRLFNLCIAPESGRVSFGSRSDGGDSMSSLLFSGAKTSWTVDAVTFQQFVEQNEISECNFIKIDIEGGEYRVVPTMTAYLRKSRPTLHLSLHPLFLGDLAARSAGAKLRRTWLRLCATIEIIRILRFYKHIYNPLGKVPHQFRTAGSRLHHRLGTRRKLIVILMACLYSIRAKPSALVLTDETW